MLRICTITFFVLRRLLRRAFKTHLCRSSPTRNCHKFRFDFFVLRHKKRERSLSRIRSLQSATTEIHKRGNCTLSFFSVRFFCCAVNSDCLPIFSVVGLNLSGLLYTRHSVCINYEVSHHLYFF